MQALGAWHLDDLALSELPFLFLIHCFTCLATILLTLLLGSARLMKWPGKDWVKQGRGKGEFFLIRGIIGRVQRELLTCQKMSIAPPHLLQSSLFILPSCCIPPCLAQFYMHVSVGICHICKAVLASRRQRPKFKLQVNHLLAVSPWAC